MTCCTIYAVENEEGGNYFPTLREARSFAVEDHRYNLCAWKKAKAFIAENYDDDEVDRPCNRKPERCKIYRVLTADVPLRTLVCRLLIGYGWQEEKKEI